MKRVARIVLPVVLLAIFAAVNSGCGVGRTSNEIWRDAGRTALHDAYMLTDDTALLLQTDRPFRGSRWVVE